MSPSTALRAGGTADLHTHTRYSDGTDTPERLIELASAAGHQAIAITDHDNTEALAIARPFAERAGIELIPGIEMSAAVDQVEVHMLGFFLDFEHPGLKQHLAEQQARRMRRIHQMVEQLQAAGVPITVADVMAKAGDGTMGRPHVAQALVARGLVKDVPEAFSKYLSPGCPGFIPGSTVAPKDVIRIIRASGGVPVLAHPIYLKNDALIEQFVGDGLAGLEVFHSGHGPSEINRYGELAKRLGLLTTGGSDYHGRAKEGVAVGMVKVPYELVEGLRAWKTAHPALVS